MALPDFTTQDPATYKANIDSTADDHETRISVRAILETIDLTGLTITNKLGFSAGSIDGSYDIYKIILSELSMSPVAYLEVYDGTWQTGLNYTVDGGTNNNVPLTNVMDVAGFNTRAYGEIVIMDAFDVSQDTLIVGNSYARNPVAGSPSYGIVNKAINGAFTVASQVTNVRVGSNSATAALTGKATLVGENY